MHFTDSMSRSACPSCELLNKWRHGNVWAARRLRWNQRHCLLWLRIWKSAVVLIFWSWEIRSNALGMDNPIVQRHGGSSDGRCGGNHRADWSGRPWKIMREWEKFYLKSNFNGEQNMGCENHGSKKYRRFLIVVDSCGIGGAKRCRTFWIRTDTLDILQETVRLQSQFNMQKLGIANFKELKNIAPVENQWDILQNSEASNGKDTMTGHWKWWDFILPSHFDIYRARFSKGTDDEKRTGHKVIVEQECAVELKS